MPDLDQRDLRQRTLIPPEKLKMIRAFVIGVGSVGRQVALQLGAIGVPNIVLFDNDTVETVNLNPQGFWESDLGLLKTKATQAVIANINPNITVTAETTHWRRSALREYHVGKDPQVYDVVFCCVDSIETRERLYEQFEGNCRLFIDTRMAAEVLRVFAVIPTNTTSSDKYKSTFFAASEAYQAACTNKTTIFTANIIAGLAITQFSKHLRGIPVDENVTMNLLSMALSVV